jgi:subtilisin family serine protease
MDHGGYRGGRGIGWGGVATGIILGTAAATAATAATAADPDDPPPRERVRRQPHRQPQQRQQKQEQPQRQPARGPRPAIDIPATAEQRFVPNEVVLQFRGSPAAPAIAALLRRHRLVSIEQERFALTNALTVRARISDRRSVRTVLRSLGNEAPLEAGQPNFLYVTSQQQDAAAPTEAMPRPTPVAATAAALPAIAGDPAQYTLGKLRLAEAHSLATGSNVLIAVIDSGVDAAHPEFGGVIAGTFDALGGASKPHKHGTAIAGAIAAHSRLMGVAPAARILAIRAFGPAGTSAEATTFAILKGVDHAAKEKARVINMSFAGPADPAVARALAAANREGIVLVAASGNFGAKSPPQYPAADPNVIAVSATDANDKLFAAANRGRHVAVSAPGVDILLPAPGSDYQVVSGTSFSAAHVSGIVALVLERRPELSPDAVREILTSTARDLGPRGKDDQFGAGLVDAYQAIVVLGGETAAAPSPQPASAQ